MKNKKMFIAEIVVVIVIVLALLIPNVVGTSRVETTSGYILSINNLDNHTTGRTSKGEEQGIIDDFVNNAKQVEFVSIDEGAKAILDEKIDAFVCNYEDASKIVQENKELTFLICHLKGLVLQMHMIKICIILL